MRRWGLVITLFYVILVVFLLVPVVATTIPKLHYWRGVGGAHAMLVKLLELVAEMREIPVWWLWAGMLISGQISLLFLSVDLSRRMLRPRQHVAVTAGITALLVALLTLAAILSLTAGWIGDADPMLRWLFPNNDLVIGNVVLLLVGMWAFWGAVFCLHYRGSSEVVSAAVSWLLRGSVLELLIAVPAHVWVQRRDDCSAPMVTGFGIATGIAIMLLSFGPGVLALYKKRIDQLSRKTQSPPTGPAS